MLTECVLGLRLTGWHDFEGVRNRSYHTGRAYCLMIESVGGHVQMHMRSWHEGY